MSLEIDHHVERKFLVERHIGGGAYGVVWRAIDRKSKATVALKKVFDAFGNPQDAQRTYREVMLLQRLSHPNIIRLHSVMKARNGADLYLAFELMETDLHAAVRSGVLQPIHKQFVTYQIVRCVRYLHSRGVLHRDLKPANILLNSDCVAKLADFGLARCVEKLAKVLEHRPILTDYIATRWYRAPEVVMSTSQYTFAIDMWAVGCIVGELLCGKPLFRGTSTLHQLSLISAGVGPVTPQELGSLGCEHAEALMANAGVDEEAKSVRVLLAGHPPDAVALVVQLLQFDPSKRLTASQALRMPYLAPFTSSAETGEELPYDGLAIPLSDTVRYSVSEYQEALYTEISEKRKEARSKHRKVTLAADPLSPLAV
jgi:mitogen-activated protein kinase 15